MSEPNQQLAAADDHEFYFSESDKAPIPKNDKLFIVEPHSNIQGDVSSLPAAGRPQRAKNLGRYEKSLEQEKLNEQRKKLRTADKDKDDNDFSSASESESEESDVLDIPNNEIALLLPSKLMPSVGKGSKRKRNKAKPGRLLTQPSIASIASTSLASVASASVASLADDASVASTPIGGAATTKTRNPIYYFYESVAQNSLQQPGEDRDRHYKCYHGNCAVVTVTKAGRHNLTKPIQNLKSASAPMYNLYSAMIGHQVTQEEIDLALGKTVFDPAKHHEFIKSFQSDQADIRHAFEKQAAAASGPWDQQEFEKLLVEWIVATDQPFDTVDSSEFRALLSYIHHKTPEISVPHWDTVKRCIMKMGSEGIDKIKSMFAKLPGKISILLDAWTSSNNFAFLAIVVHYVMEDGEAEELLIDFRELVGEHSGENMADAVWETLVRLGIQDRIMAFVMDNATNNDTLVQGIVDHAAAVGIILNAARIRLCCLPHTVHLAAIKLLKGLGVISDSEAKKARSQSGNYQESVTTIVSSDADEQAAAANDNNSENPLKLNPSTTDSILSSVDKLQKIVRAVCSSPQCKQSWLSQVKATLQSSSAPNSPKQLLMLILDVRTRWSSTHQMLARALAFQSNVHSFVLHSKDLRALELSDEEWESVKKVTTWLFHFREATTQMSTTKKPMLLTTHAIFRGLQEEIKSILTTLPLSAPPQLKVGLMNAHIKLSEYYYKYDESPFYTWAALLDPHISYEGIHDDYASDPELVLGKGYPRVTERSPSPSPTGDGYPLPGVGVTLG